MPMFEYLKWWRSTFRVSPFVFGEQWLLEHYSFIELNDTCFPVAFFLPTGPSSVFWVDMKGLICLPHYSISIYSVTVFLIFEKSYIQPKSISGFSIILYLICLFTNHHHNLLIIEALWYIFRSGRASPSSLIFFRCFMAILSYLFFYIIYL